MQADSIAIANTIPKYPNVVIIKITILASVSKITSKKHVLFKFLQ